MAHMMDATVVRRVVGAAKIKAMKLTNLLDRDKNNFDLIRLIAAGMVIYGHAYYLAPQQGLADFVGSRLPYDYSGSLAVKIFFFLSGMVVTESLLKRRSLWTFCVARVFRIWPGLIAVLLITVFVIGPLVTSLSPGEYFHHSQTYWYLLNNLKLRTDFALPGVFLELPFKGGVNGSLWSLRQEVIAYISLMALFLIGFFKIRGKTAAFLTLLGVVVLFFATDPVFGARFLFPQATPNPMIDVPLPCFALGVALTAFKDHIEIKWTMLIFLCLAYGVLSDAAYATYIFYAALFYAILCIAGQPFFLKLKPPIDISYGVYLWGFPVQQLLMYVWPDQGTRFNQVAGMLMAAVMGIASWHLVEKRGVALGRKLIALRATTRPIR
jgi:peptidoglycan/LPS O-acetylase OafA/YrhL